jgi:hypothetical protein
MAIMLPVFFMQIGAKNSMKNSKQIKETNQKSLKTEI